MFLAMASTSTILTWKHFQHRQQIMAYVAAETSYLLSISQLTQTQVPPTADRTTALNMYLHAMKDAGFSSIALATPTGEVVASTNPGQVGKKIPIKKRRLLAKQEFIRISAELKDLDPNFPVEQKPYLIQFPIVQGDKVIGYAQVRGEAEEVEELLRQWYKQRLYWILSTMLAALLAVVYLAFLFTKPLDELVQGAEQVAQGNLSLSLPVRGSDEMGRLAQTFNHMVERLRENRELQERLNEAEKLSLLGRFAATVAHEVRNSLNFINLSIDQIRAKHAGGEERAARDLQRNLGNIKDEISRLNRLVNDFLKAGRQAPPEMAPCNLKVTLEEALALVEKQAHRQEIAIAAELPADLPVFQADVAQMKTCFLNILTNAIQAMPRGGRIGITAATLPETGNGGSLQLRFADTGPGIPLEDREKVFAPFYSTKETGFGLGLAITKKIVEDHGGRVYVSDGETPGTAARRTAPGTVLVLELPLPRAALSPPATIAASPVA
jgi:signal transduction histidine kinase